MAHNLLDPENWSFCHQCLRIKYLLCVLRNHFPLCFKLCLQCLVLLQMKEWFVAYSKPLSRKLGTSCFLQRCRQPRWGGRAARAHPAGSSPASEQKKSTPGVQTKAGCLSYPIPSFHRLQWGPLVVTEALNSGVPVSP